MVILKIVKLKIIPNPLKFILTLKANLFDMSLSKFFDDNPNITYLSISKFTFTDNMIAIDGFHPSEVFYKLWAQIIHNKIEETTINV